MVDAHSPQVARHRQRCHTPIPEPVSNKTCMATLLLEAFTWCLRGGVRGPSVEHGGHFSYLTETDSVVHRQRSSIEVVDVEGY